MRTLLINGVVGAGKTATADALGDLLEEKGAPGAVIDLDWLRRSWPSHPDDPFNHVMTLRNLAPMVRNFRAGGAERLVLAGVIESAAQRDDYARTLAAVPTGLIDPAGHTEQSQQTGQTGQTGLAGPAGPAELAVCWVRVPTHEVHRRLRGRHEDGSDELDWHLKRAVELESVLAGAGVADFTVDGSLGSPQEVAAEILRIWG
jgi:adenylylsulfate kinase